jgi:putative sigma-54 modulation protein
MRLELTARHFTIPTALHKTIGQRLGHGLRVLNDSAISAQVVITREKTRFRAELTLHARGEHFLHAEATGRDAETAFAAAFDKVDRQVHKLKDKWAVKRRRGSPAKAAALAAAPAGREDGAGQVRIVRARRYDVKPMSVDEAALEVSDGRDAFVVFRNSTTEKINVLFRRADGHLGLIEPEA